jgi:putative hemolysin
MLDGIQFVLLGLFSACVVASGFLSGSETALTAIPRERVHQLEDQGKRGYRLASLANDPEGTLGTVLVANNFVNILATSVATTLAIALVGESWGPWVATVLVTIIVLIVGEVTPKTLAARRPERYALVVATPIYRLRVLLAPISRVFLAAGRLVLRVFRVTAPEDDGITGADITAMAQLGFKQGAIDTHEREIIESLFEAADQPVREVMTPRVDVVTLVAPVEAAAVRRAVAATGHARYLVVEEEGDLDTLIGVLYAKDVFRHDVEPTPAQIHRLIRDPNYVPESTPLMRVLRDLRQRRGSIAIVMDEHGGVEGLVTTKDLVGELVGGLQDEYDPRVPMTVPVGRSTWVADGRVPVDELEELLHVTLPEGPFTTIGGLFMFISGKVPEVGDRAMLDDLSMTVTAMEKQRIDKLRVQLSGGEAATTSG